MAESVGAELKKIRVKSGLTLNEAAHKMNWSISKITRIEGGAPIGISDLRMLLQTYGVTRSGTIERLIRRARNDPKNAEQRNRFKQR